MIIIEDLPLPPSMNNCYPTIRGRRVPSSDLAKFKRACAKWRDLNHEQFQHIINQTQLWHSKGLMLRVDTYFCFLASRLYTKDQRVKQLDASNYVKPIHDALAELIAIDDRYFFAGTAEKCTTSLKETECTIVTISPHLPQSKESTLEHLTVMAAG